MPASVEAVLFTKTAGYRHDSIPALIAGVQTLFPAPSHLSSTEEASALISLLPTTDLLILGNNTGAFLSGPGEKDAVHSFVRRGGAIVGIHACTAGETDWPWYGATIGAVFVGHPKPQWASIRIHDDSHFITKDFALPVESAYPADAPKCPDHLVSDTSRRTFPWYDEYYNFKTYDSSNDTRRVLVTVDETTYDGGTAGEHHPLIWTQEVGSRHSRTFYMALGHFDEAFADPWFMKMLTRGIFWATRREAEFLSG